MNSIGIPYGSFHSAAKQSSFRIKDSTCALTQFDLALYFKRDAMEVFHSVEAYRKDKKTVATIGTFDGVHIGHAKILKQLVNKAREIDGESLLISFHPHPRLVLFPDNNPLRLLHGLEEKIAMLDQLGLDKLLLIPFTRDFSRTSSKAFILDILVGAVGIDHIIIGYDHHFGKNRTGGIEELRAYSANHGYTVEEISAQMIDNASVSSTKIRQALSEGEIETANLYLGYDYSLIGEVIHGEKQGRKLGYPTANLSLNEPLKLIPKNGIYLVKVYIPAWQTERKTYYGMMNIGHKPTMGEFERGIEVNILDFDEDIYGQEIRVELIQYLREEKKFDTLEALIHAMDEDKNVSLALIKALENRS